MTPQEIEALLAPDTPHAVKVFHTLPSTNTTLRALAEEGAPHGTAIIAEGQTAGRGRLQRAFSSPPGAGLYLSMLVRGTLTKKSLPLLTPYAAQAAAEAIERVANVTVGIKWVNDLRIGEKKIAGILTEGGFSPDGSPNYAVVGIGVNLTPGALPSELSTIAAAIGDFAPPPTREVLAAAILDRFYEGLPRIADGAFLTEYRKRSVVLGRTVTATDANRTFVGKAVAIEDDGALRLDTEGGTVLLRAGEVSIKL